MISIDRIIADGITDNSAIINTALACGPGKYELPSGTIVGRNLILPGGTMLYGQGRDATFLTVGGVDASLMMISPGGGSWGLFDMQCQGSQVPGTQNQCITIPAAAIGGTMGRVMARYGYAALAIQGTDNYLHNCGFTDALGSLGNVVSNGSNFWARCSFDKDGIADAPYGFYHGTSNQSPAENTFVECDCFGWCIEDPNNYAVMVLTAGTIIPAITCGGASRIFIGGGCEFHEPGLTVLSGGCQPIIGDVVPL